MTQTPTELANLITAFLADSTHTEQDREIVYASLVGRSPTPITKSELTNVNKEGVLDCIIKTIRTELVQLVQDSRLTPKELGLILGESLGGITNAAVQFTLTKDSAYWDSVTSQKRSEIAVQELDIAKTNAKIAQAKLDQEQFQEAVLQAQVCNMVKIPKFTETSPGVFIRALDTAGNQLFEEKTSEGLSGEQKKLLIKQQKAYDNRAKLDYAGLHMEGFAIGYSTNDSAFVGSAGKLTPDLLATAITSAIPDTS